MIDLYWFENETAQRPEGGDSETSVVGMLTLDICEQDSHDISSKISSHDAEEGVPTTDNAKPEKDRVTFTAYISGRQSSVRLVDGARAGFTDLPGGRSAAGIVVPDGEADGRLADVFATLRRLCREAFEVDVEGLRMPIEGWLIERVSSPRNVETAGMLVVDVALVETRYAEVEEVDAPSPRVERGRRRQDQGRQRPTQRSDNDADSSPSRRSVAMGFLRQQGIVGD